MQEHVSYVYILASACKGTTYIGVTGNLLNRVHQHKTKVAKGFTEEYNVDRLVYFEIFHDINAAIAREKQLKGWNRDWKIKLIEKENPCWRDLYQSLMDA